MRDNFEDEVLHLLRAISFKQSVQIYQGHKIMSDIKDVNTDLVDIATAITAMGTLVDNLLAAIKAIPNVPADVQAGIDAAFTAAEADKAAIAAVLAKGNPAPAA